MPNRPTPDATVELAGAGLRLRPWRDEDAEALVEAVHESVDSVGRWLAWCHAGYGRDEAAAWIDHCWEGWRSGDHFAFAVWHRDSGQLVGSAGLSQIDHLHRRGNLGYWVRQARQRQGSGAAAAQAVARFGFGQLGLSRIEIVVLPDNRPSRAVAERIGAKFEAIARNRVWMRDSAHAAAVYGLTAQDLA